MRKGLSETTVIVKHALRNALLPVVTVIGLEFPNLIAGAVLTETVFGWPGLGRLNAALFDLRGKHRAEPVPPTPHRRAYQTRSQTETERAGTWRWPRRKRAAAGAGAIAGLSS